MEPRELLSLMMRLIHEHLIRAIESSSDPNSELWELMEELIPNYSIRETTLDDIEEAADEIASQWMSER